MKKRYITIAVLLLLAVLISGCNDLERRKRLACANDVQFYIINPIHSDGDICYDDKGTIDFILVNQGERDISGFMFILREEDRSINGTIPTRVGTGGLKSVMLHLPLKDLVEARRLEVIPKIIYEDEQIEKTEVICWTNKVVRREIGSCYG